MARRVEVKVGRFFELEEGVKPGGDVEFDTLCTFVKGFAQRAAEKLVQEHGFALETVADVLDCVLKYDRALASRTGEKQPSDVLRETIGAEAQDGPTSGT